MNHVMWCICISNNSMNHVLEGVIKNKANEEEQEGTIQVMDFNSTAMET